MSLLERDVQYRVHFFQVINLVVFSITGKYSHPVFHRNTYLKRPNNNIIYIEISMNETF